MTPDEAQLTHERKHLFEVSGIFQSVLESPRATDPEMLPFYAATVRYVVFNMNRLCLQDQRLGNLIRERCDTSDPELKTLLDALDVRLEGHRALNAVLLADAGELEAAGAEGLARFVTAARDYLAARRATQGDRKHTLVKWRDEVIGPPEWKFIAAATEGEVAAERRLYELFRTALPEGARPG